MICMQHVISSNILYFLSSVKIIPFSDLNEFEEMQPIEEEEDDIGTMDIGDDTYAKAAEGGDVELTVRGEAEGEDD